MELYAIRRRNIATTPEELQEADARSRAELAVRTDQVRHLRSYVLQEPDGGLGTHCYYEAVSPDAIRDHAAAARIPADEVYPVAGVAISVPDPVA